MTDLKNITLAKGSHAPPADDCTAPEGCIFENYNWRTRHVWTDDCPPGVSPVLHKLGIRLNDTLPDDKRQALKAYLPNGTSPLAGTRGDGLDDTRVAMAVDWALHSCARAWLAAGGLDTAALDAIPAITDRATLLAARPAIREIRGQLLDRRHAIYADLRSRVRDQVRATLAASKPADADAVAAAASVART
jgi:hypothetical protein